MANAEKALDMWWGIGYKRPSLPGKTGSQKKVGLAEILIDRPIGSC
jgi:hypothetical protein